MKASSAAMKRGIETTLKYALRSSILFFLYSSNLLPSAPKRWCHLNSSLRFHMDMSDRTTWTHPAAAKNVAVRKVSLFGAGITYMSFPEPFRKGEKGPFSTEQVRPQVVLYGNFVGSGDIKFLCSSCVQEDGWARRNSVSRLSIPAKKGFITKGFS